MDQPALLLVDCCLIQTPPTKHFGFRGWGFRVLGFRERGLGVLGFRV